MYLRLGNQYKFGKRDQALGVSTDLSEESVSKSYHLIELKVEEDYVFDSTSSMSLNARNSHLPKFSMAFNMRLMFVKKNNHNAQSYQ